MADAVAERTLPHNLEAEKSVLGAILVHYSTDYVFGGNKAAPYTETDEPDPINVYGHTKLLGEKRIRDVNAPHLIFRTCWGYGSRGRNFLLTIRKLARERTLLKVVNDQTGCPTWCRLIAEATAQVVAKSATTPRLSPPAVPPRQGSPACTSLSVYQGQWVEAST